MNAIVTKAAASIAPAEDDADTETGAFDVILSAQSLDRDGDELASDEWKTPLPEHITFDIDHGMSVATTVGSGKPFINDNGDLQVRGTYSSIARAQEVRTLVNEGHIRTTSVAFMTTKTAKSNDGKAERELLNGAFVAVPSNREAVILSSKSYDEGGEIPSGTTVAFNDTGISERVLRGLGCIKKRYESLYITKGLSGSVEDLQERLCDALCERYPDTYPWIRATFLTDPTAGTVVYEIRGDTFSRTFTDDGTAASLGDEVTDVSIITSVVTENDETEKSATDADTKSADTDEAAAIAAAELKSAEEVELRARALKITLQSYAL